MSRNVHSTNCYKNDIDASMSLYFPFIHEEQFKYLKSVFEEKYGLVIGLHHKQAMTKKKVAYYYAYLSLNWYDELEVQNFQKELLANGVNGTAVYFYSNKYWMCYKNLSPSRSAPTIFTPAVRIAGVKTDTATDVSVSPVVSPIPTFAAFPPLPTPCVNPVSEEKKEKSYLNVVLNSCKSSTSPSKFAKETSWAAFEDSSVEEVEEECFSTSTLNSEQKDHIFLELMHQEQSEFDERQLNSSFQYVDVDYVRALEADKQVLIQDYERRIVLMEFEQMHQQDESQDIQRWRPDHQKGIYRHHHVLH